MGLALQAVPQDEVLDEAQALARELATGRVAGRRRPREAAALRVPGRDRSQGRLRPRDQGIWWAGEQPDATEGVMSFLEKRDPAWTVIEDVELPEELR